MKDRHVVTDAIVLTVRDAAHADRVVTLFSRQFGKVQAIAYNSRLAKSRLGGCLQPFSVVCVSLSAEPNQAAAIKQCEVRQSFRELREDLDRFTYASLLAELVSELWPERESDAEVYDTLLAAYNTLVCRNPRLTALACGWQLLVLAGFAPQYRYCLSCGCEVAAGAGFQAVHGGAVCYSCREEAVPEFSPAMANLLRTLLQLDLKQPKKFTVNGKVLSALEVLFEDYVTCQLDRPLRSFSFLRQMMDCQTADKRQEDGNNKKNLPGG